MSNNLIEPFFSMSNDPKEYFHSFSDSIMNFGPSLEMDSGTMATGMQQQQQQPPQHLQQQQQQHHHQQQQPEVCSASQSLSHSSLSDIFKCNSGDSHFDEYHNEYSNICSPCIMDGGWIPSAPLHWLTISRLQITVWRWIVVGWISHQTSGSHAKWPNGFAIGPNTMRFKISRWPTCSIIKCPAQSCVKCNENISLLFVPSMAIWYSNHCKIYLANSGRQLIHIWAII